MEPCGCVALRWWRAGSASSSGLTSTSLDARTRASNTSRPRACSPAVDVPSGVGDDLARRWCRPAGPGAPVLRRRGENRLGLDLTSSQDEHGRSGTGDRPRAGPSARSRVTSCQLSGIAGAR